MARSARAPLSKNQAQHLPWLSWRLTLAMIKVSIDLGLGKGHLCKDKAWHWHRPRLGRRL